MYIAWDMTNRQNTEKKPRQERQGCLGCSLSAAMSEAHEGIMVDLEEMRFTISRSVVRL